ncbi:tetratricopeptide repeat protein [Polaribacter vadi]|uniref:tetratricopeptide repeat protein n=1 Tax=Polaribacter TaxID=52959 RepID=UPI001C0A365D|nr:MULTISPECIES: tetratricopeptide repeat protein [Polaribacter]MBU3009985.1 tetratricopeptide repeat protein [Polaribacter vadi]MDO6739792.1 tetratricopeptide repeat protein [Polaribacter sp. 1_MG-2023]
MKINKSILLLIVALISQLNISSQEVYDSSDLYFEEAKRDIAEQNFTRAAKMSWRGLQLAPEDLDLKTLLGKAQMQLGRYDTARYVLKQVYDRRRKDIDVLGFLVSIEQTTKRYSDAICFVNELLEITPYSRGWWRRKIVIYKEMGNYEEAERALKRLYQIYPDDTEIQNDYNYIMLNDGNSAVENRRYDDANQVYKTVIDNDPSNKQAYIGIIRNELLKGDPEIALQYTNRALLELREDSELIEKKIGLLEELGRHEEAIVYIKTEVDKAKFPTIHSETLPYLMQQSANFNEYNDSYEIQKKLLDLNGNSESQTYVINNALGKGYDVDAEYFLKKGIKRSPNNKKLLVQLKELYRPIKDKDRFEREVLILHEKYPNDTDITYDYNLVMYGRAKTLVENRQFDEALPIFEDLVSSPDFQKEAEQQIFGIYLALQKYDEATDQIDKLIGLEPDNPDYLVRKSTLYQEMELFEDALEITRGLEQQYPLEEKYPRIYVTQTEAYATYLMREQRFRAVLPVVEDGLTRENNNKRLLEIAINASSAIPDYEKGVNYSKSALSFYPNNKNFKLKLSNLLAQNNQYDDAINVLDSLKTVYKYDRKIKNSLAEVLWFRGKNKEEEGLIDEAIEDYRISDSLNSTEDYALQRMINLYIQEKPNEDALEIVNEKLEQYPNDNFLKYKKGIVFELMEQYDSAYYYQSFRQIDDPFERNEWNNALEVLKAAKLKNKLAATYTQASSDSTAFSTSLASLGYSHKYDEKNTFGADLNYAARRSGVGVQGGVNYSRVFTPTLYADVGVLLGSKFFPKFILYGNAYKGLDNGYEAQAGLRFSRLQNDINFLSLNLGLSKTWEDIWVSAKGILMRDDQFNYFNFAAQTRINVNARQDYVSFIVSFGSAPFNDQLAEGETAFLDFSNVLVGAGYGYNISPKTLLLVNGSWINFKSPVTDSTALAYINQYNLSVSIITRF